MGWDLGVRSPIFLHPKSLRLAVFGCQKMGLLTPKSENGDYFLSPTIPKNDGIDTCFTWISFSSEFWANFENHVIYAHFWPISPYKTPKSKTYGANGQYVFKKSENWYLGSLYIETIGFRRPAHKKGFFILRNTLGVKAVWIVSKNSSDLLAGPFPYFNMYQYSFDQ